MIHLGSRRHGGQTSRQRSERENEKPRERRKEKVHSASSTE